MTSRMWKFSTRWRREEVRVIRRWLWVYWVQEVKSKTVDFGSERVSPFRSAHCGTWAAWSVRAVVEM